MLPQIVPDQSFLNTADLDFEVVLDCTGDWPPAGTFFAHMKSDLSSVDIDKAFSEARGNLVRGALMSDSRVPVSFKAPAAELGGFVGAYTVDFYYERAGAVVAVFRSVWTFNQGA